MSVRIIVPAILAFLLPLTGVYGEQRWETIKKAPAVFRTGTIQVVGASGQAGGRFRAVRKAEVDAGEQLFDVVEGIYIHGSTTIQDAMLESGRVRTGIDAYMRGIEKFGEVYYPDLGMAEVAMRLNLRGPGGLYETMIPLIRSLVLGPEQMLRFLPPSATPQLPSPGGIHSMGHGGAGHGAAAGHGEAHGHGGSRGHDDHGADMDHQHQAHGSPAAGGHGGEDKGHDGVIVDAADLDFRPALLNRLLSEKDEVLYDPLGVPNRILSERGGGGYAANVEDAKALLASWGSHRPMVVKGTEVEKFTDIRVSGEDAAALYEQDARANILSRALVVFVLD